MKKKIAAGIGISQIFAGIALAQTPTVSVTVNTNLTTIDQAIEIIRKFGGWLLLIAGAVAVVFLVIGGVRYLVSAGNSSQAEAAKKTIIYALGGLVVIILSAFAVNLIMSLFQ